MMYAIKYIEENAIHSERFYNKDDAIDAIYDIAYQFDLDESELCVMEMAA